MMHINHTKIQQSHGVLHETPNAINREEHEILAS